MQTETTGAQLHAKSKEHADIVRAIADSMKVRQWAVEQAVKCGGFEAPAMAEKFYDFVTKA